MTIQHEVERKKREAKNEFIFSFQCRCVVCTLLDDRISTTTEQKGSKTLTDYHSVVTFVRLGKFSTHQRTWDSSDLPPVLAAQSDPSSHPASSIARWRKLPLQVLWNQCSWLLLI